MKKEKMKKGYTYFIICALLCISSLHAQEDENFSFSADSVETVITKALGDSAYAAGNYTTAIDVYERLLQEGESASVYYNLGNAFFKVDDVAHAILNYERAHLLDPSNKDVRFNLELARSKSIDKVAAENEIFFIKWFKSFANMLSMNTWAVIAIASFILLVCCLCIYIFSKKRSVKKLFFIFAILLALVSLLANFTANGQKRRLTNRNHAIIMTPSVVVRSTPSVNGTELFVLHEGRKVTISDNTIKDWKEIELEDGNVGWLEASALEII